MAMSKCVPVPLNIMVYRTDHECYVFVISVSVFYYPVTSQIKIQQTHVQQFVFMFITMSHFLLCIENVHTMDKQDVHYVPQ